MRENSEKGGVGTLKYIDTTPIPLNHGIHSSTPHMNSFIHTHLNSGSSAINVKCSVYRRFSEIHVSDHILHKEPRTICQNNMCCWPFVDVIIEDTPPKRRSATRAKKEKAVPAVAAEQQDQRMLVSDRLHMYPGAIPVSNAQPQPHGQLFFTGLPVQVPNQNPFWFSNHVRNGVAVAPVQVAIARGQAPPAPAPTPAAMPQVVGPLNVPEQFYVRELDGGYTLRTREQIAPMTGEWTTSSVGYPYFIRK